MSDDAERIAEAVSDGRAVDWETERKAGRASPRVIAGLRMIEQIAAAQRRYQADAALAETRPVAKPVDSAKVDVVAPGAPGVNRSWGPLVLIEKLGEGSFGEVYRAHDPVLQTDVALKLLKPSDETDARAESRFLTEARTLARVRHPNVVVVHGADRHDGRVGIWTELVQGETLDAMLRARGPLGPREAATIGIEVCHALAAVHAQGIVHRDVKTTNVMRERGGRILLMDFGTVGRVSASTTDHGIYGTPLTMAPEQLRGKAIGPAADLYAVGVMLYQLVTGRFPIEGANVFEILERHGRGERVPLRDRRPDLPAEFVNVVERCLDSDPAKRFASAGALESALAASVGLPSAATPAATRARTSPRVLVAVTIGVLLLAVGTVRFVAWYAHWSANQGTGKGSAHAAPSTAALTASAVLFRMSADHHEILEPGASVAPGTRIALQYESAESTWVYVVDEDDRGRSYLLFPVPGLWPANPLPPGRFEMLPGRLAGRSLSWQVSSTGGNEHLLAIASRRPLRELEQELARLPAARAGAAYDYPRLNAAMLGELRGIGSLAADPDTTRTALLADLLAKVEGSQLRDPGIWIWQTILRNPSRP